MASNGLPGMPAGMPPGFDMSALQNVMDDPEIRNMAEAMSKDPAFAQMTAALQQSFGGGGGMPGMPGVPGMPGMPGMPGGEGGAQFDPSQYMQAMSGVLQNPNFMQMAEKLGTQIMSSSPDMMAMMTGMQDPAYRENIESKLASLKEDPELKAIMTEIEEGGPGAMMKYWNNPEVLAKLGGAMGDPAALAARTAAAPPEEAATAEEEEVEGEEEEPTVHNTASAGDEAGLEALLAGGANQDEKDEEGRTALHFACGYGELVCAEVLLKHGAAVDTADNNQNTALHYAAGYGQEEGVALLLKHNADTEVKNLDGKTAVEVAELNEQTGVVVLMKAHATSATVIEELLPALAVA